MKDDVVFDICPKCDAVILKGVEAGLHYYLSTLTIPKRDVGVLFDWGISVYLVHRPGTKIYAQRLHNRNPPNDYWLVLEHECTRDMLNWRTHMPDYSKPIFKRKKSTPPRVFEDDTL